MSTETVVALIGLGTGVGGMAMAHVVPPLMKRLFNGRLTEAYERKAFNRQIQERLEHVETELADERALGLERERALTKLEALIAAHIDQQDSTISRMRQVLESYETRMQVLRRDAS